MLTKTKAYTTADGLVFTDKKEATRHGYTLQLRGLAGEIITTSGGDPDFSEEVATALIEKAPEIIKLLTKITEKPKAEAPAAEGEAEEGSGAE